MLFRGAYSFLSNMYDHPFQMRIGPYCLWFRCAEAAFQAQKDPARACEFAGLSGPDAKRLGRKVDLPPDWNDRRLDAMLDVLRVKFSDKELGAKLLATGDIPLVEENSWGDMFWGTCCGVGENHLGQLLEKVRAELRATLPGGPLGPNA